jgi:polyhydroxyalkanoate synthesis regulator phasin
MSNKSKSGSRRSTGRSHTNSAKKKTKEKIKKRTTKVKVKYHEETAEISAKEIADKTISNLSKLGNQIFALSPFSQYYDDWLVNLRQVISEFELNPSVKPDEQFTTERSQIFTDIESLLAEKRIQESTLTGAAKELYDQNHILGDMDSEYATKTRELADKRNADVTRLTRAVRDLEEELSGLNEVKVGYFKFKEKKALREKIDLTTRKLNSAKNELEITLQNFKIEQEKLHDDYEKRKQMVTEKVQSLEKEVEKLETDASLEDRQATCNNLSSSIHALIQRTAPVKQGT